MYLCVYVYTNSIIALIAVKYMKFRSETKKSKCDVYNREKKRRVSYLNRTTDTREETVHEDYGD